DCFTKLVDGHRGTPPHTPWVSWLAVANAAHAVIAVQGPQRCAAALRSSLRSLVHSALPGPMQGVLVSRRACCSASHALSASGRTPNAVTVCSCEERGSGDASTRRGVCRTLGL